VSAAHNSISRRPSNAALGVLQSVRLEGTWGRLQDVFPNALINSHHNASLPSGTLLSPRLMLCQCMPRVWQKLFRLFFLGYHMSCPHLLHPLRLAITSKVCVNKPHKMAAQNRLVSPVKHCRAQFGCHCISLVALQATPHIEPVMQRESLAAVLVRPDVLSLSASPDELPP
jgi:hypothetical protein